MPSQRGTGQIVKMKSSLMVKRSAVNSVRSAQLQSQGFTGTLLGLQDLRLKSSGLARHYPADVLVNAARVELTPAFDVSGRAQSEAKIRFVGPIDLIMSTTSARPSVVANLILLKSGR